MKAIGIFVFAAMSIACSRVEASTIFGGYDCGQWTKRVRGAPMESWLMGYLSGLNVQHGNAGQLPSDPLDVLNSADQAYVWVDNFCKANPLRRLDGAANELFSELKQRRQPASKLSKNL